MTISHFIIAILVGLYDKDWPGHRAQGWTSVAFLFLYMLCFGASWGPVPWAIPAGVYQVFALHFDSQLTGLADRNIPNVASCQRSCAVDLFYLDQ